MQTFYIIGKYPSGEEFYVEEYKDCLVQFKNKPQADWYVNDLNKLQQHIVYEVVEGVQ